MDRQGHKLNSLNTVPICKRSQLMDRQGHKLNFLNTISNCKSSDFGKDL